MLQSSEYVAVVPALIANRRVPESVPTAPMSWVPPGEVHPWLYAESKLPESEMLHWAIAPSVLFTANADVLTTTSPSADAVTSTLAISTVPPESVADGTCLSTANERLPSIASTRASSAETALLSSTSDERV